MPQSTDGQTAPAPAEDMTPVHPADLSHSVGLEQNDKIAVQQLDTQVVLSTPELEKRVLRKIDMHVPPLVTFLCTWSDDWPRQQG